MYTKLFALAIITQLSATGVFAQSGTGTESDTNTQPGQTNDANDETRAGDGLALRGTDWSSSLGSAIFTDTDRTTVRSADELTTQWATLSAEDREMIRRDCAAMMDSSATGTTGAAAGGMADSTTTTTDSASMTGVSDAQMQEICTTMGSMQ